MSAYTATNKFSLFTQVNPLLAVSGNNGFSVREQAVCAGNLLPFSNNTNTYYLLSPQAVIHNTLDTVQRLQSLGTIGLSLEGVSRYVYENYAENTRSMRSDTAAFWQDLLASLKNPVAVERGNQYALAYADRIYNIPTASSRTSLSDEDVPFLQMVVHGSIPYSSNARNLFYDEKIQKLQWIEYGCMPYFELTAQRANQLKYTNYNRLYTSYYEDWLDDAVSLYQEFNSTLAGTWDSVIHQHTRLSPNLVKLVYESGKTVYINYGKEVAEADGHTIAAQDYTAIG